MKLFLLSALMFSGCAGLATVERSYSLNLADSKGQAVGAAVTLRPVAGLKK